MSLLLALTGAANKINVSWLEIEAGSGSTAYSLVANAGTYSISGGSVVLTKARYLVANSGTYSLSGNTASLTKARFLVGTSGVYTLTGNTAVLTKATGSLSFSITALAGTYTVNGNSASLKISRVLVGTAGSYSITGSSATFTKARYLIANGDTYTLVGNSATLTKGFSGGAVYPSPSEVKYGIVYGPNGNDFTGTFIGNLTIEVNTGMLIKPLTSKLSTLL